MKKIVLILTCLLTVSGYAQQWNQVGQDVFGEALNDLFGFAIAYSGDGTTVAVGAPWNDNTFEDTGHVRVYKNMAGSWIQIGDDIDGDAFQDHCGWSVTLSHDGNIVAVGIQSATVSGANNMGLVRVFEMVAGTWTQVGDDIEGLQAFDHLGTSVSLSSDGATLAIGAAGNQTMDKGRAIVLENNGGSWVQIGSTIMGEALGDRFGVSIDLSSDGSIVAVGGDLNDDSGTNAGHVRIFENIGGSWIQIGLDIDGEAPQDRSGIQNSLSLSGDGSIVAIGAQYNSDGGVNAGHVRVFENFGGSWVQIGSDLDGNATDFFGNSVSLSEDGDRLAVGARYADIGGVNHGKVEVYQKTGCAWTQLGQSIFGVNPLDAAGTSVQLNVSGTMVAVGAAQGLLNSTNLGNARVFELGTTSNTPPIAVCSNYTAQLDANGQVILNGSELDGGSSDAESGISFQVCPTILDCSNIGNNTVTLIVTDAEGLVDTCTSVVTVEDTMAPALICQNITIPLDSAGTATITLADVDGGSTDNCGIASIDIDVTSFDCSNIGMNTVVITAEDIEGNVSTCPAIVTIEDSLPPDFVIGTLPGDQTRMANSSNEYILEDFTVGVEAVDNCTVSSSIVVEQDPPVGTVLTPQIYDITLTATDLMGNIVPYSFELTVESFLAVEDNRLNLASIVIYSNPAKNVIYLSNPLNLTFEVVVYDITGRMIKEFELEGAETESALDISELNAANYLMILAGKEGQITKHFVKK